MYASVRAAFADFTAQFEAPRDFMYLDVKGLVAIGHGSLIDPAPAALALPFLHDSDGAPASPAEVEAEWSAVKLRSELRLRGCAAYASITSLRLPEAALNRLTAERLTNFEQTLKRTFSAFEAWPADAQLGLLSMAWVLGPAFSGGWRQFTRACMDRRWDEASMQCHMDDTGNPQLAPRNVADAVLFANAAQIEASGMAFEEIYFPRNLAAENLGAIAGA